MFINQTKSLMFLLFSTALLGLHFHLNGQQDEVKNPEPEHNNNRGLRASTMNRQLQQAQCSLGYTAVAGLSPGSHVGRIDGLATMDDCMTECCGEDRCLAIVWHPNRSPTRCYLLNRSYNGNYRSNNNAFVANKSVGPPPSSPPSPSPSNSPTEVPSISPSVKPSSAPSNVPSDLPSATPSHEPSVTPSLSPSNVPSDVPSGSPSHEPSVTPSFSPSSFPSRSPSGIPSEFPSTMPTAGPSNLPSTVPSQTPTGSPTGTPTTAAEGMAAREVLYNEMGLVCDDYSVDAFDTCRCQQNWCNSISPDSTCRVSQEEGAVCECDLGYLGNRCEQEDSQYVEFQKENINDGGIVCDNYNNGWFHTCRCDPGFCSQFAVSANPGPTGCTCSCASTHIGQRCETRNRGNNPRD